jgi:hypothetical protein
MCSCPGGGSRSGIGQWRSWKGRIGRVLGLTSQSFFFVALLILILGKQSDLQGRQELLFALLEARDGPLR